MTPEQINPAREGMYIPQGHIPIYATFSSPVIDWHLLYTQVMFCFCFLTLSYLFTYFITSNLKYTFFPFYSLLLC